MCASIKIEPLYVREVFSYAHYTTAGYTTAGVVGCLIDSHATRSVKSLASASILVTRVAFYTPTKTAATSP